MCKISKFQCYWTKATYFAEFNVDIQQWHERFHTCCWVVLVLKHHNTTIFMCSVIGSQHSHNFYKLTNCLIYPFRIFDSYKHCNGMCRLLAFLHLSLDIIFIYSADWPSGKLPFECQKIAKNLTFVPKKMLKTFWKKLKFLAIFWEKMSSFWQFFHSQMAIFRRVSF